ncbi:mechanosensitive ion channel family protein (plasmid) [Paracoccus liaowanqingii]|uniref:Small-conductance mechanosensitive channel n=1 Tax=Paracoccus liaowanqingii TaxID=2560053 RepID=A0A4Y5SRH7_9RHOB|nr:mechanosensitive ion channel family protein [Paracoccus liaowanqingii]QDA36091.1 mechanosensitive ion channel family protein [Paracoccus liaowanqingii]
MVLGFLLAATIVLPSLRPGDLLSGLGIGSVAIGFAFKDILQNLLSGVLILLRQPFRVGDQIAVSGFEGTVEDIETRATYIKTYDGRRVVIPNSQIYTGTFTVNTAFDLRRSEYDIGIGCSDDWEKAMQLLIKVAKNCEGVLADPTPEAIPVGIDAYQNTIRLRWWTRPDQASVINTRGRVIVEACKALNAAGIDMPFPTEVHLWHDQTEQTDGDRRAQREGWPAGSDKAPGPRWQPGEKHTK